MKLLHDADWSNEAAFRIVEELMLTKLLSYNDMPDARHLASRQIYDLLRSGVRPTDNIDDAEEP
jgi:hypothetical protein